MIKWLLSNKVYKCKTKDKLKKYCDKNNFLYINYVLYYLFVLEDYEKINEIIKLKITKTKSKQYKEILNYYWCLYFIKKGDKYNADKVYFRLNTKSKVKIDILRCSDSEQQLYIFDNKFVPKIKSLNPKNSYGNLTYIMYLLNLLRKDRIISKLTEFKLITKINLILLKQSLGINDIEFLTSVIDITNLFYSLNTEINTSFPISVDVLDKVVNKLSQNIILYEKILDDLIISYNEKVCLGYRTLLSLEKKEDNQKKYLDKLTNFIKDNKVDEYTKFIFEISNSKDTSNQTNIDIYINKIKKIVTGAEKGDIMHTIYMCCGYINENDLKKFYNEFKKIKYEGDDALIRETLLLGDNLLKFWSGEKINLSFVTKNIFIGNFLKLIILLDNEEISYEDFLKQLKNIDHIELYSVFSWKKMDTILDKYNIEWLKLILEKIDCGEIDYKFKNYLSKLYLKILNHDVHIFYKDFEYLDKLILLKNKEAYFQIYSVLTTLSIYDMYNNDVKIKISNILKNSININVNKGILESFILSVIVFVARNNDEVDCDLLRKLIKERIIKNKKTMFLIGLYFIDHKPIKKQEYDLFLQTLLDIFTNNNLNDVVEFSCISHIANNILIEKNNLYTDCPDVVYYDESELIVLEKDYKEEYQIIYEKLGVKKVKKASKDISRDTLMSILICKIYFSNMEKFSAGKMIKISKKLEGKELMLELLKELGYDERQERISKIKQGYLINSLWLNEFSLHTFLKDIKSKVDHKYVNSFNKLNLYDKKIIHFTSLVLLSKLGIADKLAESSNYYCTGYVLKEITKMEGNSSIDMIDGVIEEAVCYDDYVISINGVLKELKKKKQIEYISNANILGIEEINRFNEFDQEFIKLASTYGVDNLFSIITEDPFYFNTSIFKNISYGTYSLIIDMLKKEIITGEEFFKITEELEKINYNLKIESDIYKYILTLSDDPNILKVIKILNKYN